jgi:hypothetical protein
VSGNVDSVEKLRTNPFIPVQGPQAHCNVVFSGSPINLRYMFEVMVNIRSISKRPIG